MGSNITQKNKILDLKLIFVFSNRNYPIENLDIIDLYTYILKLFINTYKIIHIFQFYRIKFKILVLVDYTLAENYKDRKDCTEL